MFSGSDCNNPADYLSSVLDSLPLLVAQQVGTAEAQQLLDSPIFQQLRYRFETQASADRLAGTEPYCLEDILNMENTYQLPVVATCTRYHRNGLFNSVIIGQVTLYRDGQGRVDSIRLSGRTETDPGETVFLDFDEIDFDLDGNSLVCQEWSETQGEILERYTLYPNSARLL
jgi:hypothetical protein